MIKLQKKKLNTNHLCFIIFRDIYCIMIKKSLCNSVYTYIILYTRIPINIINITGLFNFINGLRPRGMDYDYLNPWFNMLL